MVGRDSIVGGAAGLDGGPLLAAAGVVAPDAATLPSVADFRAAFHRRGALRHLVARHQQALLAQTPAIRRMQPVPCRVGRCGRGICARDRLLNAAPRRAGTMLPTMTGIQTRAPTGCVDWPIFLASDECQDHPAWRTARITCPPAGNELRP
jgi:hypothetical protein